MLCFQHKSILTASRFRQRKIQQRTVNHTKLHIVAKAETRWWSWDRMTACLNYVERDITCREARKIQDFNRVWACHLAMLVWCSNQLNYEATDGGNWSFVGSIVYMIHFMKIIFHSMIHSSWEHFNPQMTSSHHLWVHKSTGEAWFFFTNIFHKNLGELTDSAVPQLNLLKLTVNNINFIICMHCDVLICGMRTFLRNVFLTSSNLH